MYRYFLAGLALLTTTFPTLSPYTYAQTVELKSAITGLNNLSTISSPDNSVSIILCDKDSTPKLSPIALITVPEEAQNISIKAASLPTGTIIDAKQVSPRIWYLDQPGNWLIVITGSGITSPLHSITIGPSPAPIPIPPGPVPPGPTPPPDPTPTPVPPGPVPPVPDPIPNIANNYNVGLIAYKSAPKDRQLALWIADLYSNGAAQLHGTNGEIRDIYTVLMRISSQFANRQCKDPETCLKWATWKTTVDSALTQEQIRRKLFYKNDWYSALMEISTALKAVETSP